MFHIELVLHHMKCFKEWKRAKKFANHTKYRTTKSINTFQLRAFNLKVIPNLLCKCHKSLSAYLFLCRWAIFFIAGTYYIYHQMSWSNGLWKQKRIIFLFFLPRLSIIHKNNHHLSKRTKIISIGKLSMPHQPASSLKWKMTQLNKTINSLRWWCAHFIQQRTLLLPKIRA